MFVFIRPGIMIETLMLFVVFSALRLSKYQCSASFDAE
jgi:hypothetical protein